MTKACESLVDMFLQRVAETPDALAYQFPIGETWKSLTWRETADKVRALGCGLLSLGLAREERAAILSSTRIEWILADLAILAAGGATTTVYPSNTPEECDYILNNSNSGYVFAEDDVQLEKLESKRGALGGIKKVITLDGRPSADGWVISLQDLERLGRDFDKANPGKYDEVTKGAKREHLATLIYTSGTTGLPKGVELTHDCWVATAEGMEGLGIMSIRDHQYLWLPLSHSFGKVLEAGQIKVGFATTVDGRIPKLVDNLAVIRPTFMAAAPRIFEKVYNKIVGGVREEGGKKLKIFNWAIGVGSEVSKLRQAGKEPGGLLALKLKIADKLVFSKIKARFGGRIRFFISGSAPLAREIAEFFHAAGILILEGYGLTESSAASFVNRIDAYKFGTVGKPLAPISLKLAPEDNEILIKGRPIMRGYHGMAEATKEAITDDGWLRTGDIGEVDPQGFLKITDRKKDLIKTSGGKYVAPQKLEGQLKALCPYLGQVVVHGDNRNFCSALVTIDEESIKRWAESVGMQSLSYAELTQHPKVRGLVQEAIDQLNASLASYETVKKFAILSKDLTVEAGQLTPSLKVKRKVVERENKALLDSFYEGALA